MKPKRVMILMILQLILGTMSNGAMNYIAQKSLPIKIKVNNPSTLTYSGDFNFGKIYIIKGNEVKSNEVVIKLKTLTAYKETDIFIEKEIFLVGVKDPNKKIKVKFTFVGALPTDAGEDWKLQRVLRNKEVQVNLQGTYKVLGGEISDNYSGNVLIKAVLK